MYRRPMTAPASKESRDERKGAHSIEIDQIKKSCESDHLYDSRNNIADSKLDSAMIGYTGHRPQSSCHRRDDSDTLSQDKESRPNSPMIGYTGHRPESSQGSHSRSGSDNGVTPIVGYSGWYAGKVKGKLGRVDVHRGLISRTDSSAMGKQLDVNEDDESDENADLIALYEEAEEQLKIRRMSIEKYLNDIEKRLEDKYVSTAEKHMHVKRAFLQYDPSGKGTVSASEFETILVSLNIVLPGIEFYAVIKSFDENLNGVISYQKFIKRVCPKALT